ncbi:ParB/RepB/Spo0J family partition protein [Tissierella sp.]|uniref:ParB/RepB/Spo0J family partition protein n=1 Tax=Tissierella sp. TaxID=41274 RepID=UPI00301FC1D2
MIKLIDVNKVHHHPDNPRKDLGDLTELAESIKQSGVLQNLTLVPIEGKEEEFYAVIGNRRLAAAKLAGLTEVPSTISDMDHKTQVATMLLENMQRVDLTVYEQAQGFQMMLNLGESVSNISEKTGFSETTVRRRMKLLELNQKKLKESIERGATLMDYVELEKIEDIKIRNKVLEKIGTADFKYTFQKAIDDEKKEKIIAKIIKQLDTFATRVEERGNLSYFRSYDTYSEGTVEIPNDADIVKYFYVAGQYYITLYKENTQLKEDADSKEKERIKREKREARKAELNEISERVYKLRADFIKGLSNTKAKKNIETVIEATLYVNAETYGSISSEELADIMDIDVSDKDDVEWNDIVSHIWKQPELYLLQATYNMLDSINKKYFDYWNGAYSSNEELNYIYDFLEKLGYKMSEEEQAMKDGTHELFKAEEE